MRLSPRMMETLELIWKELGCVEAFGFRASGEGGCSRGRTSVAWTRIPRWPFPWAVMFIFHKIKARSSDDMRFKWQLGSLNYLVAWQHCK